MTQDLRSLVVLVAVAAVAAVAGRGWAQPAPSPPPAPATPAPATPAPATPAPLPPVATPAPEARPGTPRRQAGCAKADSAAPVAPATLGRPSVTWSEFVVEGQLRDSPATVRALFAPVMTRRTSLTDETRNDVISTAGEFGYHVIELGTRETPAGVLGVLRLAPQPLVRRVNIDIKQSTFTILLEDQVRRRLGIRAGNYLPWTPEDRRCELDEERAQIASYLHFEEGYFDARVDTEERRRGDGLEITIRIQLGDQYTTGIVRVAPSEALTTSMRSEIIAQFQQATCLFCFGASRFTRQRHLADIQKVVTMFQKRGYPGVRVHTSFEQNPEVSFNRRTRAVDFTVTVDLRRYIELRFTGYDTDALSVEELRDHTTFNAAASSDDVEAANSARSLVQHLQSRGWFDAHVTWFRERRQQQPFDRIWFQIELGKQRPVRQISFVGNHLFREEELVGAIGTTPENLSTSLFGGNTNATSAQLAADVESITLFYRRAGYRNARVHVEAATDPAALGSAALTAALAAAERGDGLYVRYVIDEGEPTLLTRVEVAIGSGDGRLQTPEHRELCTLALNELADLHAATLVGPSGPDRCIAEITDLRFREDAAALTRDQLKSRLYSHGRPRSEVGYEVTETAPRRVWARYTISNFQTLQIGKVVIRGNFKTRGSIILGELGLRQGALFTQDALADGARRLRNTALFDAVIVDMPDLDTTTSGEVNAVVQVVERYDFLAQVDAEVGYSSYNGAFLKLLPSFRNLFGIGMSFDLAGTIGFDLVESIQNELKLRQLGAEATLRVPPWLSRRISPVEFQTELTAFHRLNDTPRFGQVTTDGATLTLSRTWERKRIGARAARAITTGLHYDFRFRVRPIDVLRPIGADDDQTQVPISTRTGSVGVTFEWEQRVDRQGTLSPLAAEAGFRFDAQASVASLYFGGQDTFLKLSFGGSRYWPFGTNLVVRTDLRFDQGIPLGSAVLLPEVERFFAGGDSTVRGYDDDRLATEVVRVGVPPLNNLEQIRILPASGNIRVMSSIDAQLRIFWLFATGVFVDAGMIANQWSAVTVDDVRPSAGIALFRIVTPFGAFAWERAIPLRPRLGDDPHGRWHISFAARAQF